MILRLMHGTSTVATRGGTLRAPYLTDSAELARYYAIEAAEELGGDPVIALVSVDSVHLVPDRAAWLEPVMRPIPDGICDTWQTSLREVASVRSLIDLPIERIMREDANDHG